LDHPIDRRWREATGTAPGGIFVSSSVDPSGRDVDGIVIATVRDSRDAEETLITPKGVRE
jgi:hypothetical protein